MTIREAITKRVFSTLTIKAVADDQRIIRGIASTPDPDRVGDIVEPAGANFSLPIPLLWQHEADEPIGHVTKATVTDQGIEIEAQLVQVAEDGSLKERLDEAWQSIKTGLVRGLSIGFKPLEMAYMDDTGGLRFTAWDWFELSCVTIPCNAEASITAIKSLDAQQRAALGAKGLRSPAGATATPTQKTAVTGEHTMTIREMIEAAAAQLAHKSARMEALMQKSNDAGVTLDAHEGAEFDGLAGECETLKTQIKRYQALEATKIDTAKTVSGTPTGVVSVGARVEPQVKAPKLKDGLGVARYARYLGLAKGNVMQAEVMARANAHEHPDVIEMFKAAVAGGTTTHATWASPLVPTDAGPFADFVAFLRPLTILGKFGANGIPGLRRVPFRVPLISQDTGGSASWVGEGQAKPLTKFDFSNKHLLPTKIAAISVATEELLRDSSPSADALIRDALIEACRERQDTDFVDPNKAAVGQVSPASITNGVTPLAASGTDATAVRNDIKRVMAQFFAVKNPPTTGVWIMDTITALGISLMRNALGTAQEFGGLTVNGGILEGLPVIVSDYVPRTSNGGAMILVNASDIYFGDDGDFALDMSREASLLMDSAPSMNVTTPTPAQMVSMFQTNSVAFRAERTLNWMKRRAVSVAWVNNTNYAPS